MGRRRRQALTIGALAAVFALAGGAVVLTRRGYEPETTAGGSSAPAATPVTTAGAGDGAVHAVVDVAVATLWIEPDAARPLDAPSLGNPVDMDGWVGAMAVPDKLWLVGKLATQALYGDRVTVLETRGEWTKVAVERQPSSLDRRGYPGWLPTAQLAFRALPVTGRWAMVTKPAARLTAGDRVMELSFDTQLPVVGVEGPSVVVATPGGDGRLAAADVAVSDGRPRLPSGADLVRTAQAFSGLPYLWAGTSSSGYDCSGFTSSVYGAYGIVIPRDADDQAMAGTPVDPSQLEPGDLLFYAYDGGQGEIHHVSMYVGGGMMIQSPATGRTVETVPVDSAPYASELWGARRYLPDSPA
jgi:cell wall-associated NlpC family hydrolase